MRTCFRKLFFFVSLLALLSSASISTGCSDPPEKGTPVVNLNNANNENNVPDPQLCGDRSLNPGEKCDPAIPEGDLGACPTSCEATDACMTARLVGDASACTLECVEEPVGCIDDDGCCPAGCEGMDSDCSCVPDDPCAEIECGTAVNSCGTAVECACPGQMSCWQEQCVEELFLGRECVRNSDCGPRGECLTQGETGLLGGYCVESCEQDSDCPTGGDCLSNGLCLLACSDDPDCSRPGYGCVKAGSDLNDGICYPVGDGDGDVGDACTQLSDCGGGFGATCIEWDGGYCSLTCNSSLVECPAGSHCREESGRCMKTCTGNSDCRSGYGCGDLDLDGQKECVERHLGTRRVGEVCDSIGICSGGIYALCIENDMFPGGYCSRRCGPGQATCPSGSVCVEASGEDASAICVDSCENGSDCRTGYSCETVSADGDRACVSV